MMPSLTIVRQHRRGTFVGLIIAVGVLVAAGGCTAAPAGLTPDTGAAAVVDAVVDCSAMPMVNHPLSSVVDWITYDDAKELEELSTVVLTGTIDRIQDGRIYQYAGIPRSTTTVIVVGDVDTHDGTLAAGNDGYVYIEIQAMDVPRTDSGDDVFQAGTEIAAFLAPTAQSYGRIAGGEDVPNENTEWVLGDLDTVDPNAGRPAGQELYTWVSGLQGVALHYPGCDQVLWPYSGNTDKGDLADVLPGGSLLGAYNR
ncbi:MAG: hypothetical protein JWQ43_1281 [Glaciihabitans sp.]|nr:hypothetical protein [Glaciihabitans sp.]